jgi:hypothetical protein
VLVRRETSLHFAVAVEPDIWYNVFMKDDYLNPPGWSRTDESPSTRGNINSSETRKPMITIKVGAITQWVRDLLAIVLMAKLLSVLF